MFAAEFGTGQVLWSLVYFYLLFLWVWLLVRLFGDVFRSQDLSGWGKALWTMFLIVLPFLGVFVYMIARGRKMTEHDLDEAHQRDEAFRSYVRSEVEATSSTTDVDRLSKLASLRADGVIDDLEFERMKAKVTAA